MDWGKKWLVDFNAGNNQLVSFDQSINTGSIDVKMDGSVLKACVHYFLSFLFFPPNDTPSKTMKCFLFHLKRSFRSRDIQYFVIFSLPFHTLQIQKGKWKWNN